MNDNYLEIVNLLKSQPNMNEISKKVTIDSLTEELNKYKSYNSQALFDVYYSY